MNPRHSRPRTDSSCRALLSLCAVIVILAATPASATTYVMPTDSELLSKSNLVVVGKVVAAAAATDVPYATDWSFEVSDLVKGFAPGTTITVRQLGGMSPDGEIVMVALGAAPLAEGEEFVLFLEDHDDGTFRVMDFALGAFWRVPDRNLVVRNLGLSQQVTDARDPAASERARSHLPRRFDAFVAALKAEASGLISTSDYFVDPGGMVGAVERFNLTMSPPGNPPSGCPVNAGNLVRWQEFDNGQTVTIFANELGQPGVPGGGFSQIQQAVDTWNGVTGANTNLVYGGTTPVLGALPGTDMLNTIAFEDPNNFIPGSFTSNPNGTIMVTVLFFDCGVLHGFSDGIAHTLVEIGIVSQDGAGSFFFNATNFAEVITHEIGHTFGIAHSCGDLGTGPCGGLEAEAIMRALVHDDGRGGQLNDDDRAALRALYGAATPGGPTAPTDLTATATSTSTIDLAWQDNANDETGYSVEQRVPPSQDWAWLGNIAANSTAVEITGLQPASTSEFRVRAFNSTAFSNYSNEASATTFATPGPCVADQTTLCLLGDRFSVTADWSTLFGTNGQGQAVEVTPDTGYFWFFFDTNVEVVVKVLEFCADPFNSFWVFAGGLTDVAVTLTVVDTQNGATRTYSNELDTPFAPIQDTAAFSTCP